MLKILVPPGLKNKPKNPLGVDDTFQRHEAVLTFTLQN